MGGWRYPHTEEFYDIHPCPHIIQAVKSMRMRYKDMLVTAG